MRASREHLSGQCVGLSKTIKLLLIGALEKNKGKNMAYAKALIVDDSKLARITLKRKIEALGLAVVLAESGRQALDVVRSEAPDIVFMDHLMPDMDGFEATQALRADPEYAALPIIMCTGKDHDSYLEEAQAIGANQILSKPPVDDALQALLATDFSAATAVLDLSPAPDIEAILEPAADESLGALGAESPILDMSMLEGDDLLEIDDAGDDLLSDFASDSLDLGTNVIETAVPQAEPILSTDEPSKEPMAVGLDEVAVQAMIHASLASAQHTNAQNIELAIQASQAKQSEELNHLVNVAVANIQVPEAASTVELPTEDIEALCTAFIAKERISLVAEVLASVPEPEVPEFDVPRIDYDRVDQQIAQVKVEVLGAFDEKLAASQSALIGKVEALLARKLSSISKGLEAADVELMAKAAVNEHANQSAAAVAADLNRQLKQREKIVLQHLEVNKASISGLLAEMQPAAEQPDTSRVDDELDILRAKQVQLANDSAPKLMALLGLGFGAVALALSVMNFMG